MNILPSALSSAGNVDSNSAPRSSTDKNADSGFDAMLNSKPATQKPAASKPASNDPAPAKEARADDSASEASTEQASTTTSSAGDDDKPEAAGTDTDAPWPPFGLSAIVVPAPEPAAQLPAALAAATQQAAPAAPATGATPALPGTAAAVAGATPAAAPSSDDVTAELTLPMTAAANDDGGELNLDVDAPAPAAFASLLQNQALQEVRSTAPASSITAPTPTPDLNAGDFDEAIGARVGWLAEQKIGHAHIRINPENMGQIDVKLQLDGDRVHASFSSAHADVRHALESSLPRLREMLGEQGLQLSHADVGQQSSSQQQNDQNEAGSGLATGSPHDGTDLPMASSQNLRLRGLLDAYA
ncbi:hypothetical protein ABB27_08050 [Stenotrophomonas terrae]|uniref:Flagellar hook-length control protein-like C-terminal domain-containing protein n=1 Tax=Stenotrophomonas terrae TaxID=405446 RepID=A0A0R0CDX5_9GAMM|nr:flagellar hook-length control protein FliK [Stenotrophomonas terrae]KRG67945.1 hypothetical protein ABB27_08050 [Stenotrophomonas terrae]